MYVYTKCVCVAMEGKDICMYTDRIGCADGWATKKEHTAAQTKIVNDLPRES